MKNIMKPIYKPKGRAKEYGDFAINIYTGCNHGCTYCYAPLVLKRDRKVFHSAVTPRHGIVEAVKHQIDKEQITGKTIHLCFSCDPYPTDIDTTPTREVIQALKKSGNHVQILTKGGMRAQRDFDLLDGEDWFGVTISGCQQTITELNAEPGAESISSRLTALRMAHRQGIKTWVSLEPMLDTKAAPNLIRTGDYIDRFMIGKLNYAQSDIDWKKLGIECERLCRLHKRNYYIKDDLRKAMGTA